MIEYIKDNIAQSVAAKEALLSDEELLTRASQAAGLCIEAYKKGNKVLACGNGGSASDALHLVGELVGRYKLERNGICAIALNSNPAVMTAIGNDYDYDSVFARQLRALGTGGDVLFVISTSGNSVNTVKACQMARLMGVKTVALTGSSGGRLKEEADILINVPSADTPRIQEMHILLIHSICGLIEKQLYETGFFGEGNE